MSLKSLKSLMSLMSLNSLTPNIVMTIYRKSGGYQKLITYQKAEVIYDLTYLFCKRYIRSNDRTYDQMIQAARSGKQNIAEGSLAAATSAKTEIRLTNVAKASLGELLCDYQDYLRTRNLKQWEKDSVEQRFMRNACAKHNDSLYFLNIAQTRNDEVIANMAVCIISQCIILLSRQLASLEKDFLINGGFSENMLKARLKKSIGK